MSTATDPLPIRIVIGDDHPLVQAALRTALAEVMPEAEIVECHTMAAVLAAVAREPDAIDLVLLDLNMPGTQGFAGLFLMQAQHPSVPVAIISALQDETTIGRAVAYGASGYIAKSLPLGTMAQGIRAILDGEIWTPASHGHGQGQGHVAPDGDAELARRFASLSPQQIRILMLIVEGKLNKQIAAELAIAEQTVKIHVSAILRKLGAVRRTHAAMIAQRLSLRAALPPAP